MQGLKRVMVINDIKINRVLLYIVMPRGFSFYVLL